LGNGNDENKGETNEQEVGANNNDEKINIPEAKAVTASIQDALALYAQGGLSYVSTSNKFPAIPNGVFKFNYNGADVTTFRNSNGIKAQVILRPDSKVEYDAIIKKISDADMVPAITAPILASTEALETDADEIGVNGEIDERVQQGGTGDCWLITGVLALASTDAGRQIIKNSIQVNEDGSVTVTFKGLGVSYTISADEIKKYDTDNKLSDAYSNGDNDMLILELAVEKLKKDIEKGKVKIDPKLGEEYTHISEGSKTKAGAAIEGGFSAQLIYFLTGLTSESIYPKNLDNCRTERQEASILAKGLSNDELFEILQNAYDNGNTAMTFGLYGQRGIPNSKHTAKTIDGRTFTLDFSVYNEWSGHALVITNLTQDTITIVNPWDSSEEFTMTWDEFAKLGIGVISTTDLSSLAPTEPEEPETPTVPDEPVAPADPEEPVTPVEPTEPDVPVTPVDPVDPEEPVTPVEPTEPDVPVTPVDPVDPDEPVAPVEPTEPDVPVTPVDPVDPEEPVTPVEPTEPDVPVTPVDPVEPDEPVAPVEPTEPDVPVTPVDPVDPAEPTEPVVPSNKKIYTFDEIKKLPTQFIRNYLELIIERDGNNIKPVGYVLKEPYTEFSVLFPEDFPKNSSGIKPDSVIELKYNVENEEQSKYVNFYKESTITQYLGGDWWLDYKDDYFDVDIKSKLLSLKDGKTFVELEMEYRSDELRKRIENPNRWHRFNAEGFEEPLYVTANIEMIFPEEVINQFFVRHDNVTSMEIFTAGYSLKEPYTDVALVSQSRKEVVYKFSYTDEKGNKHMKIVSINKEDGSYKIQNRMFINANIIKEIIDKIKDDNFKSPREINNLYKDIVFNNSNKTIRRIIADNIIDYKYIDFFKN